MSLHVWSLPGPLSFVQGVVRDLRDGVNVVLALPARGPEGLGPEVRTGVGEVWGWCPLLATPEVSPAQQILTRLGPPRSGVYPSPRTLAADERLAGRMVWVQGVDAHQWPIWRDFVQEYAHACQARPPHLRLPVVVCLQGLPFTALPETDVCLGIHRWENVVGALDMLLYCAHRVGHTQGPEGQLLVAVAAGLALWDPALADVLCCLPAAEVLRPEGCLKDFAAVQGWTSDRAPSWEEGTEQLCEDRRLEHSALLALRGAPELRERIWAAQTGVLLPLVERRRQEVVHRVRHLLSLPYQTRFGIITDPYDLEVHDLCHQLRGRASRPLRDLVERLRRVRNALAHQEAVGPEDALAAEIYREVAG